MFFWPGTPWAEIHYRRDGFFSFLPRATPWARYCSSAAKNPGATGRLSVVISYEAPPEFRNPAAHVDFWKFAIPGGQGASANVSTMARVDG
jgi:hypothetical protein